MAAAASIRRRRRAPNAPAGAGSTSAPTAPAAPVSSPIYRPPDRRARPKQGRETLLRNEGPRGWNWLMLWRGASDWPVFLTGQSMVIAGGLNDKAVVYPIAEGSSPASRLTNWAVLVRITGGTTQVRRADWS